MVTIEINLAREVLELTKSQLLWYSAIVISFIGSIYSEPEPWGLMGLIVIGIKKGYSSFSTNFTHLKGRKEWKLRFWF